MISGGGVKNNNEGRNKVTFPAIEVKETAAAKEAIQPGPLIAAGDGVVVESTEDDGDPKYEVIRGGITEEEFVRYIFKTIVKSRRALHVFKE